MHKWSLPALLGGLHDEIERRLETARRTFAHPTSKGDASENLWRELLETYLPERYRVAKAHVVDSNGEFSDELDIVVFDRQYSPFIFRYQGQTIIPAESVYAVLEAKQSVSAAVVEYAQAKIASVRRLHRTSLPVPHAGGVHPAKAPQRICAGLLALESEWTPPLGKPLLDRLAAGRGDRAIDIGCIAAHGHFIREGSDYGLVRDGRPATAFLFGLIDLLQESATVPMIDVRAYAKWL